jgi:mutator protein MutT
LVILSVTAGLVFREGKLLMTQRPEGKHLAGLWEFPGGKQQPGETLEECLRRELREELGIEATVHELLQIREHTYPEKTVRLHFYRCSLPHGEPQPLDCAALAWVTAEQLSQYPFPPPDYSLVEQLQTGDLRFLFQTS